MAEPHDLPPLREVVRRYQLSAFKGLGQHFLLDGNMTAKIARAAGDLAGRTVYEVGPGPGGLTRALLAAGAARVIAVERDGRCREALAELATAYPGRLDVIDGDALRIDERSLLPPGTVTVANLPYNISGPLVARWLERLDLFHSLTLMFQREVAERLAAPPGGKTYGRLSVLTQWTCEVKTRFDLPPQAFVPPPKVWSRVVSLLPRPEPLAPADPAVLHRVVAAAFSQRRKMLRQSLKQLGPAAEPALAAAGIEPTMRAEQLDVAAFCRLSEAFRTLGFDLRMSG